MATRPAIFKWRQTEPILILCAVRWYLRYSLSLRGKCCNFDGVPESGPNDDSHVTFSGGQFEELLDELNLKPNVSPANPPNLPFPNHVHRFISLNRSPCRQELSKSLLGVHSAFDRSMVLFEDIVKVLHRSVPTTAAQGPFLLYICDECAVDRCQIRIDDARLRMRWITQRAAKQSFSCIGVAQRRKQEINRGAGGIDGPIQIAPAALYSNIGLLHAPGLVGRLEMPPDALLQFWTVPLHPAPHRRMVGLQPALV